MGRPKGIVKTGGRKKGTLNKTTVSVRKVFELAFDGLGGVDALQDWAAESPTEFYKLYGKLIPQDVNNRIVKGVEDLSEDELQAVAQSHERSEEINRD